ncbi:MAG: diguanylate cyclase [Candidatus Eremiobacteraeota bacterium]|nr:diguanylate cyclase [Candidatus Eremiobacteraeota bacterium]
MIRDALHPRLVFDRLEEGVIVQDDAERVREWNAAALRLLDLSEEQLLERVPPPDDWSISDAEGNAFAGGTLLVHDLLHKARTAGRMTIRRTRGDAPPVWIAIATHAGTDDAGRAATVATLTDVTARRTIERENARLREIIDALHASQTMIEESPIAMCIVDEGGQVLRRNMAFLTLAGIEESSILPLVQDEDREALREALARLAAGRTASVRVETRIRRPNGGATWCEVTGVAMRRREPEPAILLLVTDVTERRRREARLRQLAERDPLTGVHNRRSFVHILRERLAALARPVRARGPSDWSLLVIDLDGFKAVNDSCGHAVGDAVLVAVAAAIRDRTRVQDTVGRLGGDEFAVLFESRAPSNAGAVGEEMIERIRDAARSVASEPPVSASIGIVHLRSGRDADETLEAADRAMYQAKHGGKGRCVDAG